MRNIRFGMFRPPKACRTLFCMAAAVTAAALVDPMVERLSNAGVFGRGNFTDHSTLDVLPALTVGITLAAAVVAFAVWRLLTNRVYAPQWLRESADEVISSPLLSVVPAVFVLQLVTLFAMETLEQIAVTGHVLGPAIWLGGPIAFSLLLHLIGSFAATWLFSRVLRAAARTIATAVRFVLQTFIAVCEPRPVLRANRVEALPARFIEPIIARLKGRAPPYLSVAR